MGKPLQVAGMYNPIQVLSARARTGSMKGGWVLAESREVKSVLNQVNFFETAHINQSNIGNA